MHTDAFLCLGMTKNALICLFMLKNDYEYLVIAASMTIVKDLTKFFTCDDVIDTNREGIKFF